MNTHAINVKMKSLSKEIEDMRKSLTEILGWENIILPISFNEFSIRISMKEKRGNELEN